VRLEEEAFRPIFEHSLESSIEEEHNEKVESTNAVSITESPTPDEPE
jgi:hypothetical protein